MIECNNNRLLYYSNIFLILFFIFSGVSISISQILLGICTLLFIFILIKERNIYYNSGLEKYIIVFILISFILAFFSPQILKNLDYIRDFWLISAFILPSSLIKSKKQLMIVVYLFIIIAIVLSLYALLQNYLKINFLHAFSFGIAHYKSYGMYSGFRGGFLGMHLVFSCYLVFITIPLAYISLIKYSYPKKWIPWLIRSAAIISFLILFITKSRSVLIALPFSVVPLFFTNKKIPMVVFVLLLITVISIFSFSGPTENIRQNLSKNIYNADTAYDRFKIWKTAFRIWLKHPIIGSGGGNYIDEFRQVLIEYPEFDTGMVTHAHNDYINQLARKGIIGFISFIYMLFGIFRYMMINVKSIHDNLLKYLYLGIFGAFCTFLVASMFQCFFTDEENLAMLWLSIGILVAIVKVEKGNDLK